MGSHITKSSTPQLEALVEQDRRGFTRVWLRKPVKKAETEDGTEYVYEEVEFTSPSHLSEDEVKDAFGSLWNEHSGDGETLEEQVARLSSEMDDMNEALLELGDIVGGE